VSHHAAQQLGAAADEAFRNRPKGSDDHGCSSVQRGTEPLPVPSLLRTTHMCIRRGGRADQDHWSSHTAACPSPSSTRLIRSCYQASCRGPQSTAPRVQANPQGPRPRCWHIRQDMARRGERGGDSGAVRQGAPESATPRPAHARARAPRAPGPARPRDRGEHGRATASPLRPERPPSREPGKCLPAPEVVHRQGLMVPGRGWSGLSRADRPARGFAARPSAIPGRAQGVSRAMSPGEAGADQHASPSLRSGFPAVRNPGPKRCAAAVTTMPARCLEGRHGPAGLRSSP